MAALSLYFLGDIRVILDGQRLEAFRTNKVQALLIYLATENTRAQQREHLMTLLWPGMPDRSARHNLRNILYHLRQSIPDLASKAGNSGAGSIKVPLLVANRQTIQLNPAADVESDVDRLEKLADSIQKHDHLELLTCLDCRKDLEEAAKLYEGDFLSDFFLDDSNEFEEWAHARREHYRRKALDALETLTTITMRQKDYAGARTYAERQLEIDNLRESAYRQLMSILALSGQRSEALSVYETCSRLLSEELGMAPSTRTTEVYEQIQAGDLSFDKAPARGARGYDLKDEIGEGAYGAIYRAIQPAVGREVAVKVIRRKYANDPEFIRRFEAEAQTVARLEHPYIVPLYDYWRDPAGAYLVMRYLRGGNLLTALEDGPWDIESTLRMLDQIASALAAAHRQGVVHRDIKPANILLDDSGNAYLSDFGIAKDLTGEMQMTAEGAVIGTPDYISPEQILNDPVLPQTDIYSLGAVLYETLTGEKPFADSSVANLIYKHLNEPIPLVASSRPDVPPQIDQVIQKATAKRPADRYSDALTMATDFNMALKGANLTGEWMVQPPRPLVAEVYNPYKGLRAFQEADADDFYGREALVEQLIRRLGSARPEDGQGRFLAVIGPSGSGKSSTVKAGLIPALRQGALPGSKNWFIGEMVPGTHPLEELEHALWPIAVDPPPSLVEPMQRDNRGLLRTIRRILPGEDEATLLLVIDQFEELFTLVESEERREFFIDSLLTAIRAPRSPLRIVITLRADFYDKPLQYESLGRLLKERSEIVLPLNVEELAWAIREPARRVGVSLEAGLAETIIADVSDQPGALPLLQYAMTELFERRQDHQLTRAAYREIGGVRGALGQQAEALYASLDGGAPGAGSQDAARQLFLRLVTLGEGSEDTRRRVLLSEIAALGSSDQWSVDGDQQPSPNPRSPIPGVIDVFGRSRLLTFDRDPVTRGPTVEVAHEALLREWERLRKWLDESRADIRLQRLLAASAAEWRSAGQDPGFLLHSSRLDQFEGWSQETGMALTLDERDFLAASLSARRERKAAEEARRRRELETARQLAETEKARAEEQAVAARGFRRRAYVLAGVLVVAVLLAAAAFFFARQSNQNADQAEQNALIAQGNADLAATREGEALVLAEQRASAEADAVSQRDRADAEAETAREAQAAAEAARAAAEQERGNAQEQALIAQSRELASAALANLEADPELSILLALQGLEVWHTTEADSALHQAIVASPVRQSFIRNENDYKPWMAASPDGRILYVSGLGGGNALDWTTGELLYNHPLPEGDWINRADFSPDGSLLVLPGEAHDDEGQNLPSEVTIVDALTGQELVNFVAHDALIQEARFSPDGSLFATAGADPTVKVWDVEATLQAGTGQLVTTFCCLDTWNTGLAFSPGGEHLAIVMDSDVVIWDIATGETLFTLELNSNFKAVFSSDGRYLVTTGKAGNIEVWDTATGDRLSRTLHHSGGAVSDVQFSHDGTQMVSTSNNGSIILWRFSPDGLEEIRKLPSHANFIGAAAFSPDDRFLYTNSHFATRVWDISPAGSAELAAFEAHADAEVSDFQLLDDGKQMLTVGHDGLLRLWDTETWQEIRTLQAHEGKINDVAMSPDGRLIATASLDDATPKIWDANTWEQMLVLEGHELQGTVYSYYPGVYAIEFSPDGQRVATGGSDGTTRIWGAATGELLQTLIAIGYEDQNNTNQVMRLLYSPDGKLLATAGEDGTIRVWDAVEGQMLLTLISDPVEESHWSLAFSPDGKRLAAGGRSQTIEMWQLPADPWAATDEDAVRLYRLPSGAGWLEGISFSPDGERIAVAGSTGKVEIRDAGTGDLLLYLQHPAGVSKAEFTPDGKRLMTSGHDGIFRVWALDLDELVALAHSRITRDLTDEECQQYLHLESCPSDN